MNINFHPETEDYKFWTQNEDDKLRELIEVQGFGYKKAAIIMNRSYLSCASHGRTVIKLKSKYKSGIKYSINENFWSIPNEVNMYWGGFAAADASIENNSFKLEISESDKQHLQKFKNDCGFSGPIFDYERLKIIKSHGQERLLKTSKITITHPKWTDDLKQKFGIIPRKTKIIMPPNIADKNLLTRWLVGYTDGDGCIYVHKSNNSVYIKYVSSNENLIKWIKEYFDNFGSQIKKKPSNIKNYDNKYYVFGVSGLKAIQFIEYINSLNMHCLDRKWKNPKVLGAILIYKQRFPQYFIQNQV